MLIDYHLGQTSVVLRVKIRQDTTGASPGKGMTGLTSASTGLSISSIADNEATATQYTSGGSTIDTITTLGTFAAPTAGHCRFKEVDSAKHPGIYEVQIADARFAIANSKSLVVSITGVSGMADCDVCIPLRSVDPYDAVRGGMTALPNANAAANGGLPTVDASNQVKANTTQFGGQAVALDANNLPGMNVVDWKGAAAPANTGDAYAYLGTNLGALGANATAIPTAVWASGTRTLTSFGTLTTDTATAVWNALTSGMTTAGSIGLKLKNWVLGSDNKAVLSTDETGAGLSSVAPASTALSTANWTNARATKLDNLDATISSRMATFVYTTPPTTAQIATAIFTDLTAGTDFQTANSFGALIVSNVNATISSRLASSSYSAPLDAAGTRSAVGLASANLDTQLATLATEANATSNRNTLATDITTATSPLATHTDATTIEGAITALGSPMQAGSSVTVGTNNDKTGYTLSAPGVTAVQSGLATSSAQTTLQTAVSAIQSVLSGITSLGNWLRAMIRSSTPDTTALTEINTTGGTYAPATMSTQYIAGHLGGGGGGSDAGLDDITNATTYPTGTLAGSVRQILAKTNLITGAVVTTSNPVAVSQTITVKRRHDYKAADGKSLVWNLGGNFADLTGATISFAAKPGPEASNITGQIAVGGVVDVASGANQAVHVDLTAANLTVPASPYWRYDLTATYGDGDAILLASGTMTIQQDYAP